MRGNPAIIIASLFISSLSFQFSFAQQKFNFEKEWALVDSLITKKGLTKSALAEVNKIYSTAKKEKNDAHLIKSLLYSMALQQDQLEGADIKNIQQLEKEIPITTEPARSILKTILADNYLQYLQIHRNLLYDRTKTKNFNKEDIATWDIEDLHKKITALYLESLSNDRILKQTRLELFDPIIIKGNVRFLRPTIYDLLAHHALGYFTDDERYISKPAYVYEISQAITFSDAATFASYKINTPDSLSLHHKAMLLFQRLIAFHLNDQNPAALIDVDMQRLQFVRMYGVMENKDSLYEQALHGIIQANSKRKETDLAWYLIAKLHAEKARQYDPLKDTSYRFEFVEARKICERILAKSDSSEGKSYCQILLQEILMKDLNLETEKINVPGIPFRTLVSYKNASEVFFRIIKIDKATRDSRRSLSREKYWESVSKIPSIRSYSQPLPATDDHQLHRVEVKIDALPVGEYALIGSTDQKFDSSSAELVIQYFYVSDLTYISSGDDYFVVTRQEGQPVQNAIVQIWKRNYDYQKKKYDYVKAEKLMTDQNGYVHIYHKAKKSGETDYLQLEITSTNDHLFGDNDIYFTYDNQQEPTTKEEFEKDNRAVFFFTDRSIYRPGQTAFFKAILLTKDFETRSYKILPNIKSIVFLFDANGEVVDSMSVTTNQFGSYSGKFVFPENRLNGLFKIEDLEGEGQAEISVEEYKRPKFLVEYEKQKGSYKVFDTITVTGNAKAYAGNNIENAQVKYRVIRQARFPYPWLFWRIGWPRMEAQEIAHGELISNADGKFFIRFPAIPDNSIKKEYKPIFEYKIVADVTDINGETRSGQTNIEVGYQAIQLTLSVPEETMPVDSFRQVTVSTTNLAGTFEPSKIKLSIWKLDVPKRLIRERYWQQPDQFLMNEKEYLNYFPYDEFSNESKKETWNRLKKETEIFDSSRVNSQFPIRNLKLDAGWYALEVGTVDKYGDSIWDMKFIQLISSKSGEPVVPAYNWIESATQSKEPGEMANVTAGSSASNVFVIQKKDDGSDEEEGIVHADLEKREKVDSSYQFFHLNNQGKSLAIPISESNRGGFGITFAFVKHNRFYTSSSTVNVPWTNKDLSITFLTYRDKSLPGSEEKWKIKLSGYKSTNVAAEVLAAMYDASLDQFKPSSWDEPNLYPTYDPKDMWSAEYAFGYERADKLYEHSIYTERYARWYDVLATNPIIRNADGSFVPMPLVISSSNYRQFNVQVPDWRFDPDGSKPIMREYSGIGFFDLRKVSGVTVQRGEDVMADWNNMAELSVQNGVRSYRKGDVTSYLDAEGKPVEKLTNPTAEIPVSIRKNFNETAFFFPDLRTDTAGNVEFSFTMPEALTKWKWMTMAHTKDLAFGYSEKNIVTQKELMLQPNLPRFLREGDIMEISTKIVNLADSEVTGQVQLQLIDATTNESVDGWFQNMYSNQYFTAPAKGSVPAQFSVQIPHLYNKPVIVRLIARAGNVSDGEENVLPVITNRVLVTETLPLNVRGSGTKEFKLDKLIKSGGSETLQHHALTVEFTSNPAWYAVQALPYLMEFPYECAEQIWNRFYANALATKMVNASPKIKQIFEKWKTIDTAALLSNLQKNQELKSVLLQETPWVMEAKSETEQKKRIALLFDMVRMSGELSKNLDQLIQMQSPNGGFVWFKGGPDDRYITQYIISGLGHLKILDAIPANLKNKIDEMTKSGINYLDGKIKEDYDRLVKSKVDLNKQQPGYEAIQYLYMRSFFNSQAVSGNIFQAYNYYRKQSQLFWLQQNRYMQGMIALALFRTGDGKTSNDILRSLKQNAIVNEEMGMYWKENSGGYYWHQAPIETQSVLIEAFATIYKDNKIVDDLKTWLLKNKQTNNWNTTKATADACYALLLQGTDWLSNAPVVHIKLGDKSVSSTEQAEAGTGYFKKTFDGPFVNPSMGNISVSVNQPINNSTNPVSAKPARPEGRSDGAAAGKATNQPINQLTNQQSSTTWGSVYWQYFENAENITASATPLSIVKKVFVERNTDRGPVIEPIGDHAALKVGDKVKIRIELRVDRDMEYVHMKDMRASSFEPVNVLSSYKWQGGLGYYESTKDASTNFFFSSLPKGTYVFEYSLFASQVGTFSNGITTIQCMYAPEFSSHSEGIKVSVETAQ